MTWGNCGALLKDLNPNPSYCNLVPDVWLVR